MRAIIYIFNSYEINSVADFYVGSVNVVGLLVDYTIAIHSKLIGFSTIQIANLIPTSLRNGNLQMVVSIDDVE